jgi:hypothetical protein
MSEPYYRADLAFVHGEASGFHAARCAPGLLALLEPVRDAGGDLPPGLVTLIGHRAL